MQVVSVDCNPAQSALLELKATAIRCALLTGLPISSSDNPHICTWDLDSTVAAHGSLGSAFAAEAF